MRVLFRWRRRRVLLRTIVSLMRRLRESGNVGWNTTLFSGSSNNCLNMKYSKYYRLIQPELRTKGSLFHWGSSPFRFQGRTSFQNKMASQMFDQPTNVVRSPGSERQMRSLETGKIEEKRKRER